MSTAIGSRTAQLALQSTGTLNFSRWIRYWGAGGHVDGVSQLNNRQRGGDFEMNIHVSRDVITDVSQVQFATGDDRDID